MKTFFILALVLIALPATAQDHHQHGFSGAEKWAKVFDDPERDAWQKPGEVIEALKIAPDAIVADVGAGTGYFAVRLARALPGGAVIGVDAEPDMVRYLRERVSREKLTNLVAQLGGVQSPQLPGPVDLVILVDTYHHVPDRERYFRALQTSLTPRGRLAIIDFKLDAPVGPPKHARIAPRKVQEEMVKGGLQAPARARVSAAPVLPRVRAQLTRRVTPEKSGGWIHT